VFVICHLLPTKIVLACLLFDESTYASCLSALYQGLPVRYISMMNKLIRCVVFGPVNLIFPSFKNLSMPPHIKESDALVICRLKFFVSMCFFKNADSK
jgi:hypothetical protein